MMTPSRLAYRRGIRDRYADILTAPALAALARRTTATVLRSWRPASARTQADTETDG
jgi:hypothetical protein